MVMAAASAALTGCSPPPHGLETRYRATVLARALFERGELRPARRQLAALARESRDPICWVNLGIAEFRRGKLGAADRAFRTALEFDPRHARAHYWLGVSARTRAQDELRQAASGRNAASHRAEGTRLLEAAAQSLEIAAQADPISAAMRDVLATTLAELGRDADANRVRAEAQKLDPAGVGTAVGAQALGSIVLPARPASGGSGRVPLGFRSEPLARRATGTTTIDADADGRADLVLEGTNVVLRADSVAGGGVRFTERDLGPIGRIVASVKLLADGDDRPDLVLFTTPQEAEAPAPSPPAGAPAAVTAAPRPRRAGAAPAPSVTTPVWLARSGVAPAQAVATIEAAVRAVCAADLDRDGDTDFIVAVSVVPGLQVWRNDGNGRFSPDARTPGLESVPPARAVACADLNGDRRPDVAAADAAGRLRVFVQGTSGTFVDVTKNAALGAERARVIDATDVDADGAIDLLCGNDSGLWMLANRGDARFARDASYRAPQTAYAHAHRAPIGVTGFVRCDLDNDGGEDVVTLHPRVIFESPVLVAGADPTVTPARAATGPAAGEDTAPEMPLPLGRETASLALWRGTGRGVLQQLEDRFDSASVLSGGVAAADFDLDGDLDLACVRPDSVVVVHWNEGGNANRRMQIALAGAPGPRHAAVGALVEIHAGDLVQVAEMRLPVLSLGGRNLERLDVVRVAWPDGRIDNWLDVPLPPDGRVQLGAPAR
jgi:hypothetical protein